MNDTQKRKSLIFDFDSTFVKIETIDLLAELSLKDDSNAKEKISQEKREKDDIAKGIVKFLVDVYDEEGETVMLATILTMVRKLDQS